MCLQNSKILFPINVGWDGDYIVKNCKVPSSRAVIGERKKYDIDVREFLTTEKNAVIQEVLRSRVLKFLRSDAKQEFFLSHEEGSFDFRVMTIKDYIAATIKYQPMRGRDFWRFPDETIALGTGDCEDVSFLLASLMIGAGVSPYNIRVALGKVIELKGGTNEKGKSFDHAWVMYKTERGKWKLIEPLLNVIKGGKRSHRGTNATLDPNSYLYDPSFVFNIDHLWSCEHERKHRRFSEVAFIGEWNRMNPKFAGKVHLNILRDALEGADPKIKEKIAHQFILFNSVDVMDLPYRYHPEDHFDDAQIDAGWQKAKDRIRAFKSDPINNYESFFQAAHGIADFYAHSSYGSFAQRNTINGLELYCDENFKPWALAKSPDYSPGGLFDFSSSAPNKRWSVAHPDASYHQRISFWQGKLISGRYSQSKDSHDLFEATSTTVPPMIDNDEHYWALPHHNEIAVDQEKDKHGNIIYRGDYTRQFQLRRDAAVRHIRAVYESCMKPKRVN